MRRLLATKTALVSILTRNQIENEKMLPEADTIERFFSNGRVFLMDILTHSIRRVFLMDILTHLWRHVFVSQPIQFIRSLIS